MSWHGKQLHINNTALVQESVSRRGLWSRRCRVETIEQVLNTYIPSNPSSTATPTANENAMHVWGPRLSWRLIISRKYRTMRTGPWSLTDLEVGMVGDAFHGEVLRIRSVIIVVGIVFSETYHQFTPVEWSIEVVSGQWPVVNWSVQVFRWPLVNGQARYLAASDQRPCGLWTHDVHCPMSTGFASKYVTMQSV